MSGALFQKVMRGTYVNGLGYSGWTKESSQQYVTDFEASAPKVSDAGLQRNKKTYTLTWNQGKESFKALFSLEEDAFGGPVYRDDDVVVLSSKIESKPIAKAAKATKGKGDKKTSKSSPKGAWKTVDKSGEIVKSHIIPLFYLLCLQEPPKGVVFL